MLRPTLEGALVEELIKAGIDEPKRFYRPAIEAREAFDGKMAKGLQNSMETMKSLGIPISNRDHSKIRDLFDWDIYMNGLKAHYVVLERPYNPNFSMAGVNAVIMANNCDERFAIAESKDNGNEIMILAAHGSGKFSIIAAENIGSKYDISGIQKLKKKENASVVDFSIEVAKLLKGK